MSTKIPYTQVCGIFTFDFYFLSIHFSLKFAFGILEVIVKKLIGFVEKSSKYAIIKAEE